MREFRAFHGRCAVGVLAWACLAPLAGGAIVIGQKDDFQDSSTDHWTNGPAPDPVNISTGGPGGAGDRYLRISAKGGSGAGSKLISFNQTQWIGNYNAAGVTSVGMDLENLSTSALPMRIAFESNSGGAEWATTTAFSLPADNAWHHAIFALSASQMKEVAGSTSFANSLASVRELRVLASQTPSWQGESISAAIGVDNIAAVPEPAGMVVVVTAGALVLRRRR